MNEIFKGFGIEGKLLLWQSINFGVLFVLLWYFLYKPLRRIMQAREEKISESLKQAEALERKSKEFDEEFQKKMSKQRREIEEIHTRAQAQQEKLQKELKERSEVEAQKMLAEARKLAQLEKSEILKSVEQEIKELAVALAVKIITKKIDEESERNLINEALQELRKKHE